jgi:hypothetical protein
MLTSLMQQLQGGDGVLAVVVVLALTQPCSAARKVADRVVRALLALL